MMARDLDGLVLTGYWNSLHIGSTDFDIPAARVQRQSAMDHPSVLVVDDEPAVRELLKLHLANAGYDVRLAEDAIVAGRALMESPPDVMLVDVAMPYMGGLEFVATLNADSSVPHVPVIFITGREEVLNRAKALGAGCLKKPFEAQALIELVQRHARARSQAAGVRLFLFGNLSDQLEQCARVEGLREVMVEAGELREDPVGGHFPAGHRDE